MMQSPEPLEGHLHIAEEKYSIQESLFNLRESIQQLLASLMFWKKSLKQLILFAAFAGAITCFLLWRQTKTASSLLDQKIALTLEYLASEGEKEAGGSDKNEPKDEPVDEPNYLGALDSHRVLLDRATAALEKRKQKLSANSQAKTAEFENALRQAKEILHRENDEKHAYALIKEAAGILENVSKKIMTANAEKLRFGRPLDPVEAKPFIDSFKADIEAFHTAASRVIKVETSSFQDAEDSCMQSRFSAMSALLAWPEMKTDSKAMLELNIFIAKLEEVRSLTITMAERLEKAAENEKDPQKKKIFGKQHRLLTNYSFSELRRLNLLDALRKNDMGAAQDALACHIQNPDGTFKVPSHK